MKLQTIEMPQQEACKAFLEYRRAVRERHNEEDAQIMRCYKALANGHHVIDLNDVMRRAGTDKTLRPRLAVANASDQRVSYEYEVSGSVEFYPRGLHPWRRRSNAIYRGTIFRFPAGTLPTLERSETQTWYSVVPNIPPGLRPAHDLRNYTLLWEAKWERVPAAPRDPALLRWLGGSLYAVLAVWDLTAVERAVLGLTRN